MPYADKDEQKFAQAVHYKQNKDKYRESSKKARDKRTLAIQRLKIDGCKHCGEKHISCLDFHHRVNEDKLFGISEGVTKFSMSKILEEIAKCDLICSNCHRKLHWIEDHPQNTEGVIN